MELSEQPKKDTSKVDRYISNLKEFKDVQTNILQLREFVKDFSNYICHEGLTAIFTVCIQYRLDDQLISDIFKILTDLITDQQYAQENAELIIRNEFAIPLLIDSLNTDNPKKKVAVIQIISKLALLQSSSMQNVLLLNQDRLIQFLTIIDDDSPVIRYNFLSLIPILVDNNPDFQLLFAFNIMTKLIEIIRNKTPLSISALNSLLYKNVKTQKLFFNVHNLKIIEELLICNDIESVTFITELFSSEEAKQFKYLLKETNIIQIAIEKSLNGSEQFIKLLGYCIEDNEEYIQIVLADGNVLKSIFYYYITNINEKLICFSIFFKCLLNGKYLDVVNNLSLLITKCEDRSNERVIDLATFCLISNNECQQIYYNDSTFLISMIGYFISQINTENVLNFLIVLLYVSKESRDIFLNEESNPLSFLIDFANKKEMEPIIYLKCILLLQIICTMNELSPQNVDLIEIRLNLTNILSYLKNQQQNEINNFLQKITNKLLYFEEEEEMKEEENEKENNIKEEEDFDNNEIRKLRNQIQFLEAKIDSIKTKSQNEVNEIKQKMSQSNIMYQSEISRLQNEKHEKFYKIAEELKNKCNNIKIEFDLLQLHHKTLFDQQLQEFREERTKINKIIEENKELKFKVSQITKEKEVLLEENNHLKEYKQIKQNETQNQNDQIEIENYKLQIKELEQEIFNNDKNKNEEIVINQNLKEQNMKLKTQNLELNNLIQTKIIELKNIESNNLELKDKIFELEQKLRKTNLSKCESETIKNENNSLKDKIVSLKSKLQNQNNINNELELIKEENLKLNTKITHLEKINNLLKEISNPKSKRKRKTSKEKSLELNIQQLQKELIKIKEENESYKKQCKSLIDQNNKLISQIAQLNKCINENTSHDQFKVLSDEIEKLTKMNSILNDKCIKLHSEKVELSHQNSVLNSQIKKSNSYFRSINLNKFNTIKDSFSEYDDGSNTQFSSMEFSFDSSHSYFPVSKDVNDSDYALIS